MWTTGVSNPYRSPHLHSSASVYIGIKIILLLTKNYPRKLPSPLVFLAEFSHFNSNFTNSTFFWYTLAEMFFLHLPEVISGLSQKTAFKPPTNPLRSVETSNACPSRITAAAGTQLAGAYNTIMHVIIYRLLKTLQHFTYLLFILHCRCFALSYIEQDSLLLPSVEV